MPKTYDPVASTTLRAAASEITFSSIPSTYNDLVICIYGRSTDGGASWRDVRVQFNNDSSGSYSRTNLYADNSGVFTNRSTNETSFYLACISAGQSASGIFGFGLLQVYQYTNTNFFKTATLLSSRGAADAWRTVNMWRSTSAITSMRFFPNVGNFDTGTSISIYGIKVA